MRRRESEDLRVPLNIAGYWRGGIELIRWNRRIIAIPEDNQIDTRDRQQCDLKCQAPCGAFLLKPTIRVFSRQRSYAVHQGSVKITGFLIDNPQTTLLSCKEPLA